MRDLTDRFAQAERRLSELSGRLAAARCQLEQVEARHEAQAHLSEGARVRMLASETAQANREWEEARRVEQVLAARCRQARAAVAELEGAQGALFDDLLV